MYPTIKQLKYLVAVSKFRHFGHAADACAVSQSTLSAGIQELEKQLDILLFERTNKQVLITAKGQKILDKANQTLDALDLLIAEARSAEEPLAGKLSMGVIPTIGPFLLPALLPELRVRFPRLQLYLEERQSEALLQKLHSGDLDVLLMALPYPSPDTTQRHLFYDRFQLACQDTHPFAHSGDLHTMQLEGEELLLLEEGHCIREHALSACNLRSADYGRPYQLTSLHTLVQMVANGLGITLLPEMAIQAGILTGTQLTVKAFADDQVSRSVGLVWRRTHTRSDELNLLADSIQDIWLKLKNQNKAKR